MKVYFLEKQEMSKRDFYEVLGLKKGANKDDIKRAYRKLAMQYHPDRNQGDDTAEAKFKEVAEAYGTLWDDSKKQQYDMFGSTGGGAASWFGWGGGFQWEDISDIFNSFFGWGFSGWQTRQARREQRGEDLEYDFRIDLKTSIYGGKETIEFNKREHCGSCDGDGGSWKKNCDTCGGVGQVTYTSNSPFGVIQQTRACPDCNGSGETFENTCTECHGEKRKLTKQKLDIDIPAGIDDGMVIKMTDEWNAGIGTKAAGSLYIRFHVQTEEKGLERDGVDLHYRVEIDLLEALLGTKKDINIPILGKRSISIDAGTQHDTVLKISGDGVKHIDRDAKGDLLIVLHIPMPKKLGKKERELYEEIAKEKKVNVNSKKGVFEKLFS